MAKYMNTFTGTVPEYDFGEEKITPKKGDKSMCGCGHEVVFTGEGWRHTDINPRHPAIPEEKFRA